MPVLSASASPTFTLPGAHFTSLATPSLGATHTSVWRVEIAPGHPATPHQVTHEEIFVVLSGAARIRLGADVREARAGDTIVVPRDTSFEIDAVGPEAMSALCCMPVGGQARLVDGTEFVPPWAE
jgi:quercetin dioxygenase-like cupin family protein